MDKKERQRIASKKYYEKNKEIRKERIKEINKKAKKKYYKKNKNKINEDSIIWAKKNPEKIKLNQKKHYEKYRKEKVENARKYLRKNHKEILEKAREKNKTEEQRKKNREKAKKWREKNSEIRKQKKKEYAIKFPERVQAHRIMYNAIRNKKIERPNNCSKCMKECKPEAHHIDYTKPLDVVWLCRMCHAQEHRLR